jgi:hypothetical protein
MNANFSLEFERKTLGVDRRIILEWVLDIQSEKLCTGDRGENCTVMNFTACILHQILLG